MVRHNTPEQFQEYQQQWTQAVADDGVEGHRRKQNAAYWVAYCHLCGKGGVERDDEQAQRILQQVIEEQDNIADGGNHNDNTGKHRCLLAWIVDEGGDHARSNQLFCQASPRLEMEVQQGGNDENCQEAAFWLGWSLVDGKGVDEDKPRGIHWLKNAAELGHAGAQHVIEHHCFREPFVAEIVSWLQQIADQNNNNAWAQLKLGDCYKNGEGVEKDFVQAVEWYNKAITQGYDRATRWKQSLLQRLSPEERTQTMGCVARNQKIEKARDLVQQSFVGEVPLSLWSHSLASFQNQENPPWEAPSPTFLALGDAIMPQLQKQLKKQEKKNKKRFAVRQ